MAGLWANLGRWQAAPPSAPREGSAAPIFTLEGLDGRLHHLDEWRSHRVVLVFWAPWSAPARAQAAMLSHLDLQEGDVLVDVAMDWVDRREILEVVGSSAGIHLIGRPSALTAWGTFPSLPVVCIVDVDGNVTAMHDGLLDAERLQGLIGRSSARSTRSSGSVLRNFSPRTTTTAISAM